MNLILDKATGNLYIDNNDFKLRNENFIKNSSYLIKIMELNGGYKRYSFIVYLFHHNFYLNIDFIGNEFDSYFFLNANDECFDENCLKDQFSKLVLSIDEELKMKAKNES